MLIFRKLRKGLSNSTRTLNTIATHTELDPIASTKTVITDFSDEMGEIQEVDVPTLQTGFSPDQYRKKVEAYIRAQADHITIAKLKRNHPLIEADLTALEEMLFTAEAIESRDRFMHKLLQDHFAAMELE